MYRTTPSAITAQSAAVACGTVDIVVNGLTSVVVEDRKLVFAVVDGLCVADVCSFVLCEGVAVLVVVGRSVEALLVSVVGAFPAIVAVLCDVVVVLTDAVVCVGLLVIGSPSVLSEEQAVSNNTPHTNRKSIVCRIGSPLFLT